MPLQMDTLLIFFLNRSFLDIVEKNQKPGFLNQRVPPISVYNLKWRANFQIYRLHIRDSDWLNFIQFSGCKYKIRLVSILRKRKDHALISISTILKFSALIFNTFYVNKEICSFQSTSLFNTEIYNLYSSVNCPPTIETGPTQQILH